MHRFDNFKRQAHNTSSSFLSLNRNNNYKQDERGNRYNGIKTHVKMNVDSIDSFGNELFPELVKNVNNNEKLTSSTKWTDVLHTSQDDNSVEDSIYNINVNNTKYWTGAKWIGPMMMRGVKNISSPWNKYTIPCNSYQGQENELCLINSIEYSRDGTNWYSSWEETFTTIQLENQSKQNELNEMYEVQQLCNDNYERIERESNKYYNELGELDDYAKAKEERLKYEEYESKFDQNIEDSDGDVETELSIEDDDEYLEYDYN